MNIRYILMTLGLSLSLLTGVHAQRANNTPAVTPQTLLERAESSLYSAGATLVDFSTELRDKAGRSAGATTGKMHLQGDAFRLEYGTITAVYASGTLTYYDSAGYGRLYSPAQEQYHQRSGYLPGK